ncbi:MAG: hypothetical protein WA993_19825 [Candidatus Binatus sp.]|uniref:hypothetical protein n=1 Tax=Candidatus Binatus sp. TaxID=2811406 RepID=UPI003CB3ABBA
MTIPRNDAGEKIAWQGVLLSVQPRIRLTRSFDQRSHTYLGYARKVSGRVGSEARQFLVGVGQGAHTKHQFRAGNAVSGDALPVPDPGFETVEFYKVSKLKVGLPEAENEAPPPPWRGVPPPLAVYRERGHRRLAARTFQEKCSSCIWGCRMPVKMIIDQWNPTRRRYRTETFCYGPLSCSLYQSGPARTVPGRRGMTYTEEDWVDDEATSHRRPEE